jgi:predicted MPP superfamily phosphohydrolase
MKVRLRKKLSLLLVLALVLALFCGLPPSALAADETAYLAFASDVHYSTEYTQNNLDVWLQNIKKVVPKIEYMGFCGDMGSAYAANAADYWAYTQAVYDTVDGYISSGYREKVATYTFGNHEWYPSAGGDYANNKDNPAAKRLLRIGEAIKTDKYIIYCFGASGSSQEYASADIAELKAYLEKAPADIPIIILTHYPLHFYSSRISANAAEVVDVLNEHPNVIYLWGHNHTSGDINYDRFYKAGDTIEVSAGNEMELNFTYCSAGCMSDLEYHSGNGSVKGKGLVLALTDRKIVFTYYAMDGAALEASLSLDMDAVGKANLNGPFTVTFKDSLDGSVIATQTVEKGGSATPPAAPVHEKYVFKGWNRQPTNITKNTIVTALYEKKKIPTAAPVGLESKYVYISLALEGKTAVGKSGKPIVLYPIPYVKDMTITDAVAKQQER